MRIPTPRQKTAKLFFALGHQRRLKILDHLQQSSAPLTYEQIWTATRMSQGALTHHLRILSDVGLINRTIKNRYSFYRPNRALLHDVLRIRSLEDFAA